MLSVAVFVDAGYLFAQGSAAITGSKKPRHTIRLDEDRVVAALASLATGISGCDRLLRIYWYDAARPGNVLQLDHSRLAHMNHVKLRLGFMNSQNQQKGVDSLIVTDLIELARNHAMSDAVLVSGDEDVRIGVQIAQSYGVRVHLLGIRPARGSQSLQLLQEADTTREWQPDEIADFLQIDSAIVPDAVPMTAPEMTAPGEITGVPDDLAEVARRFVSGLTAEQGAVAMDSLSDSRKIPAELDRGLLARAALSLGRKLADEEKKALRRSFREALTR